MNETLAYALMYAMAAALGAVVFALIWLPLRKLLRANSLLVATAPFFTRTLLIVLVIGALAPIVGESLDINDQTAAMEIVWQAADKLGNSLLAVGLYLFGFVIVMAVLAATLGRHHDE